VHASAFVDTNIWVYAHLKALWRWSSPAVPW
jgi:hypothetical protein